jgi:hypothetical protein
VDYSRNSQSLRQNPKAVPAGSLGDSARCPAMLHSPRTPSGERLHQKLQRSAARRMPERRVVRISLSRTRKTAAMAKPLNLKRPHSALDDRTPASFAGDQAASAACFTPIERNTASCGAGQGFAAPAKDPALHPVPRSPEYLQNRGEALLEIAHARGSPLSLWSELQARQSSSGELDRQNL